jgi:hypothetical protein
MDKSNAKRNQAIGLEILGKTLTTMNSMPKHNFMNVKDFEDFFADEKQLIIDATEQAIQRLSDKEGSSKFRGVATRCSI